jgi:hypothetical protein
LEINLSSGKGPPLTVEIIVVQHFTSLSANGLALGAVADFGAQNCQYTTKADAR